MMRRMGAVSNLQEREKNPGEDFQNNPGAQDNPLMAQCESGRVNLLPDNVVQICELLKFSMQPEHGAVTYFHGPFKHDT